MLHFLYTLPYALLNLQYKTKKNANDFGQDYERIGAVKTENAGRKAVLRLCFALQIQIIGNQFLHQLIAINLAN